MPDPQPNPHPWLRPPAEPPLPAPEAQNPWPILIIVSSLSLFTIAGTFTVITDPVMRWIFLGSGLACVVGTGTLALWMRYRR